MSTVENATKPAMKVLHRASSRGTANFGWLHSRHTFSFGNYFDPERVSFGALRVLNDDLVKGGAGFPTHPHENMEIVSIPLRGALEHKDTTGTDGVINTGDVQIMSAGSGIAHSEFNHAANDPVAFLQIWVFPKLRDIEPRYEQRTFDPTDRRNRFQVVVSPEKDANSLWINQDAYFSLADLDSGQTLQYRLHDEMNGVYLFLIEGEVQVVGDVLGQRDAIGLAGTGSVQIEASKDSSLLAIEVPMR